jgi:hypothetical protein
MWGIRKYVQRAKRTVVNQDWETDDGKIVTGRILYEFLDTLADLANNDTAIMACGIPSICRATGMSRSTVIRCLAIARRHRFIVDTGERLPAPYDTIMYKMDALVFLRLAKGYLDTYYSSADEVMGNMGFEGESAGETADLLHFQLDIIDVLYAKAWREHRYPTDEELLKAAHAWWRPRLRRQWTAAQRRSAFLTVAAKMGLDEPKSFEAVANMEMGAIA